MEEKRPSMAMASFVSIREGQQRRVYHTTRVLTTMSASTAGCILISVLLAMVLGGQAVPRTARMGPRLSTSLRLRGGKSLGGDVGHGSSGADAAAAQGVQVYTTESYLKALCEHPKLSLCELTICRM